MRELKEVMKTKPMERDSLQVKHSFPDSNQGDQTSTESQTSVCNAGEQQMLQTPVKIEVKQEEMKENTAEEQQRTDEDDGDDDEQQMLQTSVKIEVKQEEIKENTAEEHQRTDEDDDDDEQQMLQTPVKMCSVKLVDCRNLIKMRETTTDEQESDDDVIHSGEGALQMDLDSDEEFTLSSEEEQDSEEERLHFEEQLDPAEDAILDDDESEDGSDPDRFDSGEEDQILDGIDPFEDLNQETTEQPSTSAESRTPTARPLPHSTTSAPPAAHRSRSPPAAHRSRSPPAARRSIFPRPGSSSTATEPLRSSATPALRSPHRGRRPSVSQSQFGSPVGQSLSPVRCPAPPDQLEQGWKTEKDPDVAPILHRFCPRLEPGVQLDTSVEQSPLCLFKHFFSADSIRTLCANTNKLAERNIAAGKRYKWTTINPAEMFKFIGLVLYMGVLKLPAVSDYWKRKTFFL
ncbi:uncharacterized protein LOC127625261 [Xyrauchen texanus]|uniref:uncharacterized protein LOC127625261 n=1 Tax=Xyrauchen texanus TaxID=154827 RepID=UPI0022423EC5|nr:uncharacterized protein LOC127625261 [Xyrauchen texanus]